MSRKKLQSEIVFVAALLAGLTAVADIEQWTLADGTPFDAEFVMEMTGYATFINAEGKQVKVALNQLSKESRTQIELKNPPELEFDLVKDQDKAIFAGSGPGARPPEDRVRYGARIFTRSNVTYDYPLDLEVFVIGKQRLGDDGDTYILFDKFEVTFRLNKENGRKFEYKNDRVVILRNYYGGNGRFVIGEDYFGFLAIVKDVRGEVIATFSSQKWLQNGNFETLRERYVGNYMDKNFVRTHPQRPDKSVLWD